MFFDEFLFTYSEYCDKQFDNKDDWIEYLSPETWEAYCEYTSDKNYKENY